MVVVVVAGCTVYEEVEDGCHPDPAPVRDRLRHGRKLNLLGSSQEPAPAWRSVAWRTGSGSFPDALSSAARTRPHPA